MSPRVNSAMDAVTQHDHSDPVNGGQLSVRALAPGSNIARLDSAAGVQTFAQSLVIPGVRLTAAAELANLNTTPLQSTIGAYICLDGAAAITEARTWNRPDASGEYVVSKTIVALTGRTTSVSGDVLVGPNAGHYGFMIYVEVTTAGLAGTLAVAITHTGAGGVCTQTPIASLALTAKGASSTFVVCKVASGDVTYAFTLTGVGGSPVYNASVVPIGRVA